ncbi:hypothetical protein SAMN05519103_08512 [Rhizobiales bacterium GAS113]|nr:hypothetical protein SAMN05519103_08512 [Rhizobiales bacterium GAS113]
MAGALDHTEPKHLLAKLEHEVQVLSGDHRNSYAAINALRDAYHLREWTWHDRLEHDHVLQTAIMGAPGNESDWCAWVNRRFPDFPIIRDLCNGSKHFEPAPNPKVHATLQAGYGSPLYAYNTGMLGYNVAGFFVQVDAGRIVSVANLVERARDFWADLFKQFPQLG